jgi:hypothetical protein
LQSIIQAARATGLHKLLNALTIRSLK